MEQSHQKLFPGDSTLCQADNTNHQHCGEVSSGDGTCCYARCSEFHPQDPHGEISKTISTDTQMIDRQTDGETDKGSIKQAPKTSNHHSVVFSLHKEGILTHYSMDEP